MTNQKTNLVQEAILQDVIEEINLVKNIKDLTDDLANDDIKTAINNLLNINLKALLEVQADLEK
jgi:hypothetical protein